MGKMCLKKDKNSAETFGNILTQLTSYDEKQYEILKLSRNCLNGGP